MNFITQIERIKKMHSLIQTEKTGNPRDFAQQMNLSRSHLYNLIEQIKEMDAHIKYCKKKECFYYEKPFDLVFVYSLKTITDRETREIFGGHHLRPMILDGSMITLC
ncbi:hypothetical protein [Flavobacterium sp. HJJ]|uniref:hypothetical protein n=1 Tax=Flavobacterium sp. HJJ TaxID=2783792 RepID=UPI001889C898|nr:hypothetical protein [Flavobacterium sp. HJJ]MBF4471756.1 hypothetical protein [Flavobacterium sp. HJJ]